MNECKHCGAQIYRDGPVWVDNSGGDVCGWDGGNEPHEPLHPHIERGVSDYMKVTLLVKPGPGAKSVVQSKLNQWVSEDREQPFPPGSLLHYTVEDDEMWGES